MHIAAVVLDKSIDRPLDYSIPEHLAAKIKPGIRVHVPVRGKLRKGTVLSLLSKTAVKNILPIEEVLSEMDVLTPDLFSLADWMSRYYATPIDRCLSSMLPASVKKDLKEKTEVQIQLAVSKEKISSFLQENRSRLAKQALILDEMLKASGPMLLKELLKLAKVSESSIASLIEKGLLQKKRVKEQTTELEVDEFIPTPPKVLSLEQERTFASISSSLQEKRFATHLIHGITGSGKTEIYLRAIQEALSLGKASILLVPEISLTTQTIERLTARLQRKIAVIHHRLSDRERLKTWEAMRKQEIDVVVGARSAIFSPLPHLGLIIVDEEHEQSYKQSEEMPCYHARDLAVMRGKITSSTVILGSATPTLESYYNALQGKYELHKLTKRPLDFKKPEVTIVNMNLECNKAKGLTLFSEPLLDRIKKKLTSGEQTILFLNRRGYYTSRLCTSCLKPIHCKHCDVSMTYHRGEEILSCHMCGFSLPTALEKCPSCGEKETLKYKGPGTEQVERLLHAIFPSCRTLRMDRDTTKQKGSHDRIFKQFRAGKADILIGTQMIAKGLHFPSVTLVGILNADSSLNIPDFRSHETVFQLLTQVAGRSGRGLLPGEVIIQSFLTDHPIIRLAFEDDYEQFFHKELEERKLFQYPPFTRLTKIVFSGSDLPKVTRTADTYYATLKRALPKDFSLSPLHPPAHAKIKDRHRLQCLIKGQNTLLLSSILKSLRVKVPNSVRIQLDIDPTSTFF